MRFSRERSCSVEIPGRTRCSSTKRRGPPARSRTMSSVHLSPTRSNARASGAHWLYGWRLGGGVVAMGGLLIAGNGGAARRTSRIDPPSEPVHTLMVQFSTYVRLHFGPSKRRKVLRRRALEPLSDALHA